MQRTQNDARALGLLELFAKILELLVERLARIFQTQHLDRIAGSRRTSISPDRIDQVVLDGNKARTAFPRNLLMQLAGISFALSGSGHLHVSRKTSHLP